jgi:hypothetical protein
VQFDESLAYSGPAPDSTNIVTNSWPSSATAGPDDIEALRRKGISSQR